MARPENDGSVRFLYGTALGRGLLKTIQVLHMDRLAVWFLRSGLSRPYMAQFAKKNQIPISKEELKAFPTYRDFFLREREPHPVDTDPGHLISPCDGWLSAYGIQPDSSFAIKNSLYRVKDLLGDETLARNYQGGTCLIFRLCASDYHHIACEHFPIFTLNRRSWCLLDTAHFGPVVQTEIGALVVGGIVNRPEGPMVRGQEKGYFDLCGSTIVLLMEPGRIELLPELAALMGTEQEVRVEQGQWVATAIYK